MKRTLTTLFSFAVLASFGLGLPTASAADGSLLSALQRYGTETLTRAEVLAWSTAYLFDDVHWDGTRPPFNATVTNIAGQTKALAVWGANASATLGTEPTSRCQAIAVLFRLTNSQSAYPGDKLGFRDVVSQADRKNVQQAMVWDMAEPLGATYFGCRRSLRAEELAQMLRGIGEHVKLPLRVDLPEQVKKTGRARPSGASTPVIRIDLSTPSNEKSSLPRNEILEGVWKLLQEKFLYLENVDEEELGYAMAEALVAGMKDNYTTFMRPRRAQAFQESLQGELSGIGAQVEPHAQGGVLVISPLSGSPAMQAGVLPGDRIVAVDEKDIISMNLQDAVDLIRGPAGTDVKLQIERNGSKTTITVTRAHITVPEVEFTIQENVAVIKLLQFGQLTRTDLEPMLRTAVDQKVVGIILDLRNNPGGYLETAIDVLGHFVPKDTVVAQIQGKVARQGSSTRRSMQVISARMPMVVLVNKGSASASEIVAGALQDLKRATVLGEQTFGKGSVQEIFNSNAQWSVKYTIAEWLTPNGRSIQEAGITPDVIVQDTRQDGGRDEQLLQAVKIVQGKSKGR